MASSHLSHKCVSEWIQSPLWKPANVSLTESPSNPSLHYCKHFARRDQIFIFVNLLDPRVVANESVVCVWEGKFLVPLFGQGKKQAIQLFRLQIIALLD